LEYSLRYLSLF